MTTLKQSQLADIKVTNIAPTVNDDISLRFGVGSKWFDTATQSFYICEDATAGAAVWTQASGGGGGGGSLVKTYSVQGTTLALTTLAGDVVTVWAKGSYQPPNGNTQTIDLTYDGVIKDTATFNRNGADANGWNPFALEYTETPGAGTKNVVVFPNSGSVQDVVIIAQVVTPGSNNAIDVKIFDDFIGASVSGNNIISNYFWTGTVATPSLTTSTDPNYPGQITVTSNMLLTPGTPLGGILNGDELEILFKCTGTPGSGNRSLFAFTGSGGEEARLLANAASNLLIGMDVSGTITTQTTFSDWTNFHRYKIVCNNATTGEFEFFLDGVSFGTITVGSTSINTFVLSSSGFGLIVDFISFKRTVVR